MIGHWIGPLVLGGMLAAVVGAAGEEQTGAAPSRGDRPPRKVIVGTAVQGFWGKHPGVEPRLGQLEALVEEMAARAATAYPGRGLDLVVLPETAVTAGGNARAAARAVPFAGAVRERFMALARRHRAYVVAPLDLAEGEGAARRYTNAAVLLDRRGEVVGIYRKVHPVVPLGENDLEGGITPGSEFPVFDCDFGRLGIQICYDMVYDDGWAALAEQGADLVVWPSASPATAQPAARARQHHYYLVSSTYRDNATIFEPTGVIAAQVRAPGRILVQELDLSYVLLPWSSRLQNGRVFHERFGDRAGFHYYEAEDIGLFWSNDPAVPVAEMARQLGLAEVNADIERNRQLQDAARGRPARR